MKIKCFEMPKGDTRYASVSFVASAGRLGTSVSSVTWSVEEGTTVTISGTPTLTSGVAKALLVASSDIKGCSLIKVKATMADSQTVSEYFKINVIDLEC